MQSTLAPLDASRRRRVVAAAAAAVVFAFLLVVLPGPTRNPGALGVAGAVGVLVVVLAASWRCSPVLARVGTPAAFIALVALLIDSGGGTSSGYGGLFLLPMLWLASLGSRQELVLGFLFVLVARALPLRIVGEPRYPSSEWRAAIVLGAVAVIACVTIQELLQHARVRGRQLAERAVALEQARAQLEEQNRQLRDLDRLKTEFLTLVSHQLRTPLTSIKGYLELLTGEDGEPLTPTQHRFLTTADRNADRLTTLVNDLLFLMQVDAGAIELHLAPTDIGELLHSTLASAAPAAAAKGVLLAQEGEGPVLALCDRGRIVQVVEGLLANAITFTPAGGRIAVRGLRVAGGVEIAVSDTGIGIPHDEQEQLFDRFFRASSATDGVFPGTGLGLAIAQSIAEAHQSRIVVESAPGRGSTFRLLLPAA